MRLKILFSASNYIDVVRWLSTRQAVEILPNFLNAELNLNKGVNTQPKILAYTSFDTMQLNLQSAYVDEIMPLRNDCVNGAEKSVNGVTQWTTLCYAELNLGKRGG